MVNWSLPVRSSVRIATHVVVSGDYCESNGLADRQFGLDHVRAVDVTYSTSSVLKGPSGNSSWPSATRRFLISDCAINHSHKEFIP
jgi:hypothetical protein